MTFDKFLLVLRSRWISALVTLLLTVALAVAVSLLLPKQYTAVTSILVDVKSPDPIAGVVLPALVMPGYMATQSEIIMSDRVAVRVVQMLKLDSNATLRQQWLDEEAGQGRFEYWVAGLLQRKLTVKPSHESNIINVSFKSPDPKFSAAVANAFAQAYIEANVALSVEPARQYSEFFVQRQEDLRRKLNEAQHRLAEYQQVHGVVASDERLDSENQKLAELQTQYVIALGQETDAASKKSSAAAPETLPDVLQSPVVGQLKSQIAISEAKLQDLSGNLGRNHPLYQRAEAELATLKQQLADETARVTHGVSTAGKISQGKSVAMQAQIEAAKKRILELKKARGDITVLQGEVESAQRALEAVTQKATETKLQSQTTQTNIAVLSPAVEPPEPSFPRMVLNIAISVFLGTFFGVAMAFARESRDPRVRGRQDLVRLPYLNVLAELPAK